MNPLLAHISGKHHDRSANVVFCDAHVEYAMSNLWKAPANYRWNKDPQTHPGF